MPTDSDGSGYDLRDEARRALNGGAFDSVKIACAAFVAAVLVLSTAGAGLAVLNRFDLNVFFGLSLGAVLSWPVAFAIIELVRLHYHSRLLREVLASEKYYETLVAETRRERDGLKGLLTEAEVRLQVVMAARDIIGVLESPRGHRELPPGTPKETEHA